MARLLMNSLGPDWSQGYMEKAHGRPAIRVLVRQTVGSNQTGGPHADGRYSPWPVLGVGALAAIQGYMWVRNGEIWKAVLLGVGAALGVGIGGWIWHRWKGSRNRVYDPLLIREKVGRIAFDAEVQVTTILPAESGSQRAEEILDRVAAAYRHFDNPAGARFKAGQGQVPCARS